jgi:hypothetical protein
MTMKKLFALALGFFMACAVYGATCADLQVTLQAAVTAHITLHNNANAACVAASNGHPEGCGSVNPGGEVQTQTFQGATQKRFHTWVYNQPINGSIRTDQYGTWTTCGDNVCALKIGKPGITNFTIGYTRTDGLGVNSDDYSCVGSCNQIPASKQMCDSGCIVDLGEPKAAWRSVEPTSNGLYRLSLDMLSVPTGAQCTSTAADAPVNPATPQPPCPGFVGEINGKKGCYGTAQTPITTTQADRSAQGAQPANPAAGEKPSTGEGSGSTGSGRTPSTGTGGPSGGPASAANGPSGRVTAPPSGEQQAECGAPGQPRCAIDETGTPTGGTTFDRAKTDLTNWGDQKKNAIDGAAGIQAPTWSFTFQLPTGCTPVQTMLESFVLDICPYQSIIHDLMSMVWAAVTAFTIIGMVGRTIRES